ncbi:MAG: BrnT family toxin [Bauldia sp.]
MAGEPSFEWDVEKDRINRRKHGVAFFEAQRAFLDPHRVIAEDLTHGTGEQRYFCFGRTNIGVMTVRFTYRGGRIRIIGAGCWRKGKTIYDRENGPLHQG